VIRNLAVQPEPAEPAIRQIEMDLFAKPPFGADAHAVADNQHAHHQLGVDRGSPHLAVERLQRLAKIFEVEVAVDAPEHVIEGDVLVEAEIIEQPSRRPLTSHHRRFSCRISRIQTITPPPWRQCPIDFFNDIRQEQSSNDWPAADYRQTGLETSA
jgi:hypothetical protein